MRKTSANDILLYELCPKKWAYSNKGKKRSNQLFAFYRYSAALHHACKKFTEDPSSLFTIFEEYWGRYEHGYPLTYKEGESWQSLHDLGLLHLKKFRNLIEIKHIEPIVTENKLEVAIGDYIYVVQPDLAGQRGSEFITVEYKTSDEPINPIWIKASDQLTGQVMAICANFDIKPPMPVAVCNFVKENAGIQWIEGSRDESHLTEYARKVTAIIKMMEQGQIWKRSLYSFSSPCYFCDFANECHTPGIDIESFAAAGVEDEYIGSL